MSEQDFTSPANDESSAAAPPVFNGTAAAHLARSGAGDEGFYIVNSPSSDGTVRALAQMIQRQQKAGNGQ